MTPERAEDWPEQQLMDTIAILNVEAEVERRRTAEMKANTGGSTKSPAERAAATELAFQNLPRIERPAVDP